MMGERTVAQEALFYKNLESDIPIAGRHRCSRRPLDDLQFAASDSETAVRITVASSGLPATACAALYCASLCAVNITTETPR